MLKHYEDAEKTLRPLLKSFPDHHQLFIWMGVSLMGQKRIPEAEKYFKQALKINSRLPEVYYNLGLLNFSRNNYIEADNLLSQSFELRPNLYTALYYRGLIATRLKKNQQAIGLFKKALQIDPAHTRSYIELAEVLNISGLKNEALRYLKHGQKHARNPEKISGVLKSYNKGSLNNKVIND